MIVRMNSIFDHHFRMDYCIREYYLTKHVIPAKYSGLLAGGIKVHGREN